MVAVKSVKKASSSGLGARIVTGLVLAVVALGLIWLGKWPFNLLVFVMSVIISFEWSAMHRARSYVRLPALVFTAAIVLLSGFYGPSVALPALGGGVIAILLLGRFSINAAAGLLYASLPAIALIWLRGLDDGLMLVLWAMAIVWATDIFAYFTGRAIGGPKIWPAISPNKTWAGLIGGMTAAALVSMLIGDQAAWGYPNTTLLLVGAGLAITAQIGDFFESGLKRKARVKDSGKIFPGHGGVMDRVDGLIPVVCVVALLVAFA